MIKLFLREDCE